jgi:hypothetical protein
VAAASKNGTLLALEIAMMKAANLETWSRHEWKDGVQIVDLDDLETLVIKTRNSTYEITIICGRDGDVLVRGGQFFPQKTEAHLSGASLGGSFLKLHGIYVGMSMEILHEGRSIITSTVQSIALALEPAA